MELGPQTQLIISSLIFLWCNLISDLKPHSADVVKNINFLIHFLIYSKLYILQANSFFLRVLFPLVELVQCRDLRMGKHDDGNSCSLGHWSAGSPFRSLFPWSLACGHLCWTFPWVLCPWSDHIALVSQALPLSVGPLKAGPPSLLWESTGSFLAIFSSCCGCGKYVSLHFPARNFNNTCPNFS